MSIETRCSGCGKIVQIDEQYAGRRARCTHCRTEFTVPHQSDLEALDSVCHFCGAAVTVGSQSEQQFKTCDLCAESIAENTQALQEEHHRLEGQKRFLMLLGALAVAALTILSLGSMFF